MNSIYNNIFSVVVLCLQIAYFGQKSNIRKPLSAGKKKKKKKSTISVGLQGLRQKLRHSTSESEREKPKNFKFRICSMCYTNLNIVSEWPVAAACFFLWQSKDTYFGIITQTTTTTKYFVPHLFNRKSVSYFVFFFKQKTKTTTTKGYAKFSFC